jgi:hypothetical protein
MRFKIDKLIRTFSYTDIILFVIIIPSLGYLFYRNEALSIMVLEQKGLINQFTLYSEIQSSAIKKLVEINLMQKNDIYLLEKELHRSYIISLTLIATLLLPFFIPLLINPLRCAYELILPAISNSYKYFIDSNDSSYSPDQFLSNKIYSEFTDASGNKLVFSLSKSDGGVIINILKGGEVYNLESTLDLLCSRIILDNHFNDVAGVSYELSDLTLTVLNYLT